MIIIDDLALTLGSEAETALFAHLALTGVNSVAIYAQGVLMCSVTPTAEGKLIYVHGEPAILASADDVCDTFSTLCDNKEREEREEPHGKTQDGSN